MIGWREVIVYMIGYGLVDGASLVGGVKVLQVHDGSDRVIDASVGRVAEAGNLAIGRCIRSIRGTE